MGTTKFFLSVRPIGIWLDNLQLSFDLGKIMASGPIVADPKIHYSDPSELLENIFTTKYTVAS